MFFSKLHTWVLENLSFEEKNSSLKEGFRTSKEISLDFQSHDLFIVYPHNQHFMGKIINFYCGSIVSGCKLIKKGGTTWGMAPPQFIAAMKKFELFYTLI